MGDFETALRHNLTARVVLRPLTKRVEVERNIDFLLGRNVVLQETMPRVSQAIATSLLLYGESFLTLSSYEAFEAAKDITDFRFRNPRHPVERDPLTFIMPNLKVLDIHEFELLVSRCLLPGVGINLVVSNQGVSLPVLDKPAFLIARSSRTRGKIRVTLTTQETAEHFAALRQLADDEGRLF